MNKQKRLIALSFVMLGATSISAQIIILRELLTIFYGNELSIGTILAGWLLLISAGSIIAGKFCEHIKRKLESFSVILMLLSFAIPLTVFLSRTIKHAMGLMPGEIIGFGPVFYISIIALSVFCVPYGFLFPLGARIYSQFYSDKAESTGSVFFLETAGTVIGGIITSLFLVKILSSMAIAFILGTLNIVIAVMLIQNIGRDSAKILKYMSIAILVLNLLAWPAGLAGRTERLSNRLMWQPFNLIKSENSIYGNLAVTSEKSQLSFYSNGGFMFNFPDIRAAEEAIHYAMIFCANPKNVLLIGGGLNGSLNELYKYNLTSVEYVELDPALIALAKDTAGESLKVQLANPILKIIESDGRFYIKRTNEKYDAIILSVPSPHTAQINRFYTKEFFEEAGRKLNKNGILFLSCEAGENYIGPEMAEYLATIYKTLTAAGFSVKIIPGEAVRFIAMNSISAASSVDAKTFQKILDERSIKTQFIRDYYLSDALSREKIAYTEKAILNVKGARINTDFNPVSYYYDMVLWAVPFQPGIKPFLKCINEKTVWYFLIFIYLLILGIRIKRKNIVNKSVFIAIGTTGLTQMATEVNMMLAFQVIYGYLYYELGLILTSFMAGLFAGSYVISRRLSLISAPLMLLRKSKFILSALSFLLIPIFKIQADQNPACLTAAEAIMIFPILIFIFGILGGMQFPLASKIVLGERKDVGKVAGWLYGTDLIGGMIGAVLISAILIPVLGIFKCLAAMGILNFISASTIPSAAYPKTR
ncbi:MAG: fused MFS/spermidine synthase [Candidatus Omnitrophica bacterium]|nr:fused MFS/spermidine synthase [Candidatus Omnitrophota bacterium]